jgi:hypothetical protein
MTAEDIMAGLLRSLQRMNEALRGAWETRPEGDWETEGELLDALAIGQEMEEEIRQIIEERRWENEAPDNGEGSG